MMRLSAITLAAAASFALFPASSYAVIISFEGVGAGTTNVNPGAPYSEAGFTFTPSTGESATFNPASTLIGDASVGSFGFGVGNVVTMTGPGVFNLGSLDVGALSFAPGGIADMTITADVFGGGTVSASFLGLSSITHEVLNWTNLTDVKFSTTTDAGIDNLSTNSSIPEPATLALLGISLAGLGFSRRRKQ